MKKAAICVLLFSMALSLFAGCAGVGEETSSSTPGSGADPNAVSASSVDSEAQPIKVGVIYEASGNLEDWGEQEIRGIQFGFEYATDETMTINGRPVELYIEDSASDASVATEKAIKLCETYEVDIMCGTTNTAVAQAIQAVALQYEVPYFVGCAAGDGICSTNYNDYTFMIGRNVSQVAKALAYALEGKENFAFMFADYAGGHQFGDAYTEAIEQSGGNNVYEEYPPMDCPDFTSYLMAVKTVEPDALLIACTGNSFETILPSQYNELGMSKYYALVADFSDNENIKAIGMNAEGMIGCCSYYYTNYDTPENNWLVEHHQEKYGEPPIFWTGNGFTLSLAICSVLEEADSTDPQVIIETAEGHNFRGVRGDYQIRAEDHVSRQPLPVVELQDTGLSDRLEPVLVKLLSWEETDPPIRNGK